MSIDSIGMVKTKMVPIVRQLRLYSPKLGYRNIHTSFIQCQKKLDFHDTATKSAATGESKTKEHKKADRDPSKDSRFLPSDYQTIREKYQTPKHPIVLCHGLCGFDSLDFNPLDNLPKYLKFPNFSYWHGIKEALVANGMQVHTMAVPPTASIESRARVLLSRLVESLTPKDLNPDSSTPKLSVNLIGHSMGGLDARYLITYLIPEHNRTAKVPIQVLSLTTIATPHHGSSIADLLISSSFGPEAHPRLYGLIPTLGFPDNTTEGFHNLTRQYVEQTFNPSTPDDSNVRYFSYGAAAKPGLLNPFRPFWRKLLALEGANDGLVSVESAKWGEYVGTVDGVDHLDLVNFGNLVRYNWKRILWGEKGIEKDGQFNAVALYLYVTDRLAKEGF